MKKEGSNSAVKSMENTGIGLRISLKDMAATFVMVKKKTMMKLKKNYQNYTQNSIFQIQNSQNMMKNIE